MDSYLQPLSWIVSVLLSGLIGVIISILYHKRQEIRFAKFSTLRDFFGYRYDLAKPEFFKVLNEIFIVFQDADKVLHALNEFHQVSVTGNSPLANDKLKRLAKEMCVDLKIDLDKVDDSFFLRPFRPTGYES